MVTASTAWLLSFVINDSSIADVFWGVHFVAITLSMLLTQGSSTLLVLQAVLVSVWGFRLAAHIGSRKIGKPEDWRYAQWREEWGKWFQVRSFLQNYLFQGLLALIISTPTILIAYAGQDSISWWQWLGVIVWTVGFSIEAISDFQLSTFLKQKNRGKVMDKGLWNYSRHPNYFGELTVWWGIWLITLGLPYWPISIISPLLISFLIIFVSGIPMLEKKFKTDPAYKEYLRRTSILIPLPPKKEAA